MNGEEMKKTNLIGIFAAMVLIGLASTEAETPERGDLVITVDGIQAGGGVVVAHLFRKGDELFGEKKLVVKGRLTDHTNLTFENLPFGEYALLVFQDLNQNGALDHNLLRIPAEPLGLSNNFKPSIFTGPPEFSDIAFQFSQSMTVQVMLDGF
jgi:uncharacterized protein (DUF2141 family)